MTRKNQISHEPRAKRKDLMRRAVLLTAATTALPLAMSAVAQAAPTAPERSQPIAGTAAPSHAGSTRTGDAPATRTMSVAVTLPLRHEAALKAFVAAVSDRTSPTYGQYLTTQQFVSTYAPTQASANQVASYLRSEGLATTTSSNRTVVDATGTVADLQKAFGTTIGAYRDNGTHRAYVSNDQQVSMPSDVASQVLGVVGLDDHHVRTTSARSVGSGPAGGYTPSELKGAYDVTALASAGDTGSGQTVGLFELAGFKQTNITTYDNNYSLGSPTPTITSVDGGNTTLGDAEVEVELDIEVVQALAPKANVKVFEAPNSDAGVIDGYNAIASSNTTASNSSSWGECEADSTTSEINSEDQAFQEMAAQGQSIFAASGDSAAYDCGTQGTLGVDNPADDPYVTGAGGTHLTLSGTSYGSETPWDTNATEGGGGGGSTVFAKPSWQTGDNVPSTCASKRCVPDISGDADPATGYSIYSQGAWTVVGGTSAAAPLWAGFTAVYDQAAAAAGKAKLGYANPTLYSLAGAAQTYAPFHDVTTGHTSTATNWPATTGYDLATGIGSFDGNNLARDLLGSGGGTTTNDFSISATSASVKQGASGTSTVSTAVTSGSAQTVALSASGLPAGVTASFSPTSVTAGGSATLTLTASSSAAAGSSTVTVTGTGASATHTATVALTVTSAGGTSCTTALLGNGGFETGAAAPWTLSSGVLNSSTSEPAHSGSYDAWFDGYGSTHTDTGTQSITVPAGCTTATVQFYLHVDTAETTTSTAYDTFTVKLGSTTLGTFSNLNKVSGYAVHTYNVTGLTAGSTYSLSFTGKEDSSAQTSFVLDDVSVVG